MENDVQNPTSNKSLVIAISIVVITAIVTGAVVYTLSKTSFGELKQELEQRIAELETQIRGLLEKDKIVACTEDARLCPGGTSVGRSGPDCEFDPCPMDDWETYSPYTSGHLYNYSLQVPKESVCEHVGHGPPINFGSNYTVGPYCYHGIYVANDEYPYGLILDHTSLPEDLAKTGLLKNEYENGVESDIDFDGVDAVMISGEDTIEVYDAQSGESQDKKFLYTRYVLTPGNNIWHMMTIETDLQSTNLELYKQILSTIEFDK